MSHAIINVGNAELSLNAEATTAENHSKMADALPAKNLDFSPLSSETSEGTNRLRLPGPILLSRGKFNFHIRMDSINKTDVISYFERLQDIIAKNMRLNWQTLILDLLNSSRVDKVPERRS